MLGAVRGTVHAGATGDRNAFITALSMRPHVMKIADIVSTHTYLQDETVRPSIARLDGQAYLYRSTGEFRVVGGSEKWVKLL